LRKGKEREGTRKVGVIFEKSVFYFIKYVKSCTKEKVMKTMIINRRENGERGERERREKIFSPNQKYLSSTKKKSEKSVMRDEINPKVTQGPEKDPQINREYKQQVAKINISRYKKMSFRNQWLLPTS
jgi:hypothetical protein